MVGAHFYDIPGSGRTFTTYPGQDALLRHTRVGAQFNDIPGSPLIKKSLNEETLAAKIELAVTTSLRKSLPEDVLEKALKKQTEQLGRVVEEKLVMTTLDEESVEVTGGEKGPWKEVRRKPTNFMETLKEASESARIESDLQAKRDRNIIIHNVEETGKGTEARSHDEGFVNKLFSDVLDIGTDIIDVARLGRKRDTEGPQKRPLMISLWQQYGKAESDEPTQEPQRCPNPVSIE